MSLANAPATPTYGPPPVEVPTEEEIAEIEAEARRRRRVNGLRKVVAGAFFCALGLGVSLFTHLSAGQAGGIYLVWYGPVAGGAWLAVKGLLDLRGQGALPTAVSWRPKPVR